ncbi:MAG: hypothetical protein AABW50_04580 [Nanoarchaeota archaeon]
MNKKFKEILERYGYNRMGKFVIELMRECSIEERRVGSTTSYLAQMLNCSRSMPEKYKVGILKLTKNDKEMEELLNNIGAVRDKSNPNYALILAFNNYYSIVQEKFFSSNQKGKLEILLELEEFSNKLSTSKQP